jgi:hypothetical protein
MSWALRLVEQQLKDAQAERDALAARLVDAERLLRECVASGYFDATRLGGQMEAWLAGPTKAAPGDAG